MKQIALIFVLAALMLQTAVAQTGTMTDSRNGKTYKTISFENEILGISVTWMAENLAYKSEEGCWAYDNNAQYANRFGYLYTYDTALKSCPSGWHLPSATDWTVLADRFGGTTTAGTKLKAQKGWLENGNGDNSSGFNALPGGYRHTNGTFVYAGKDGYWWTSTTSGGTNAMYRSLYYDGGEVDSNRFLRRLGYSVRCVKD